MKIVLFIQNLHWATLGKFGKNWAIFYSKPVLGYFGKIGVFFIQTSGHAGLDAPCLGTVDIKLNPSVGVFVDFLHFQVIQTDPTQRVNVKSH